MKILTCKAPVNIAVIKYWGKRDEELILPLNDSLSGTLSTDHMCSTTTVAICQSFPKDRIWLNGKEESFENPRLINCIREVKAKAKSSGRMSEEELSWHMYICSENNFPTAAGLASSAAGYACLVYSLCQLYEIEGDISTIARQGSGSACRSIYGGFVEWIRGKEKDGRDSIANQIVDTNHWPEMKVLILVVSDNKKKTSSTTGMQTSVETSEFLKYRVEKCVPENMKNMKKAIVDRDFETFARITMQDSNQFHAVCLDTYPPCVYMNDVSHAIADLIHVINGDSGKHIIAYTFDAGPNACLYLLEKDIPAVISAINFMFPSDKPYQEYYRGITTAAPTKLLPKNGLPSVLKKTPWDKEALRYIIHTEIGDGPQILSSTCHESNHLLNAEGHPKFLV